MVNTLMASLALAADDPVKDTVLGLLATYGGLAALVTFLVSGVKALWKGWAESKEGYLTVVLSYGLGIAAKLATDFYGPGSVKSWALHLLLLAFVAVGAATLHDKFLNVLQGKATSPPPTDAPPAPPPAPPAK